VKATVREFVFFGADHGEEEVEWRTQKYKIDYQFGRSLPREKAMTSEPFLAWALNGEPLSKHQGAPLRLIVPGWYGVANVKWLSEIHLQEEQYLGKYQARWYRTVRTEMIDGVMKVSETAVTHMQLKSFIARVTNSGNAHRVLAVVLNDGTPIKSVEVKVDDGPWQMATTDPTTKDKFGWKFYNYTWNGATPGDHMLVSRATDVTGRVQPTAKDLESKKSFLEENSQSPRKLKIA
jgi:DMSO/TMAO reductase YedYZ molybdopterin-dependent catalytic subunit